LNQWMEKEKKNQTEIWLRRVRQFYCTVDEADDTSTSSNDPLNIKAKIPTLVEVLTHIPFNQCIIFCNDKFR
jgi:superfamily II DNA/RNA helicase